MYLQSINKQNTSLPPLVISVRMYDAVHKFIHSMYSVVGYTFMCVHMHRYECVCVCFRSIFLEIRVYGNNNNTLSPTALTITIITVTKATTTTTTATAAAAKHTTLTTKPALALVDVTKRVAAAHADSLSQQLCCPDAAADLTCARSILSTFLLALSARIAPLFREPVRVCARMNIT